MHISQIFISDSCASMGPQLEEAASAIKGLFKDCIYTLYGAEEIYELISKKFSHDVLRAYESLVPYAYKADLARYCILYEHGGWYFDIGMRHAGTVVGVDSNTSIIAFRDINRYSLTNYACDNCIIYAKARHASLAKAIELIINNVNNKFYGQTPLCPTGPSLWGRALAITGLDSGVLFGDAIELTPNHKRKNKAMILPDGTILAYKKPSGGGDLRSLGATGTNNYNIFWREKRVYTHQ